MSFEKLNETSMNNVHDRSCIIIVNANKKETSMINGRWLKSHRENG